MRSGARRARHGSGRAGIGQAAACALAAAGASVVVTDQHPERTKTAASRIADETGATVVPMTLDVTREDAIAEVVAATEQELGPIDILVNNAGLTRPEPLTEMSTDTWRLIQDVCLTSQFLTMRAVLPSMVARHAGVVVNVASSYGWLGTNTGEAHYIAAKAGVMGLTRAAAAEVGPFGIRVNAVAPGLIFNEFLRRHFDETFSSGSWRRLRSGERGGLRTWQAWSCSSPGPRAASSPARSSVSGGWYMHA